MSPEVDAGFEDVSQQGGPTEVSTPAGATEQPSERTFDVGGKTLTADEAQERLQTSDEAYQRMQGERDRAIQQAEQGRQAVDAWEYVYREQPELYKQIVETKTAPAPATALTTAPPLSGQPVAPPEQVAVYEDRIARLEQQGQAQEQRYYDAWAASEEAKAMDYYKNVTGNDMSETWKRGLHTERARTRNLDLVSLTRSLLFEDVQAGRVNLNREAIAATQAAATRGATQGAEGAVPPVLDIATMSDEDVYKMGKAGLNLPQDDTRWVGNR